MDLSFEAFKTVYEAKMQSTLNPLINEFSEQYLRWKQTKLLELMNEKLDRMDSGRTKVK